MFTFDYLVKIRGIATGARWLDCENASYGTRDAPQIWPGTAKTDIIYLGFKTSELHPPVYWSLSRGLWVVVHADGCMCIGLPEDLQWLCSSLHNTCVLKKRTLEPRGENEVKPEVWGVHGIEWECYAKHACSLEDVRDSRHPRPRVSGDEPPGRFGWWPRQKSKEKFAIASYMSQERSDLAVVQRVLSRRMASKPYRGYWVSFHACQILLAIASAGSVVVSARC